VKLSRSAVALYVGLIFACGAVLGAFSHRFYTVTTVNAKASKNPEEFRQRYMTEMKGRLTLTPEQYTKLEFILDETRARIRDAQKKLDPEIVEIRLEQIDKIRGMLTANQRPLYEQLRKEREERAKQKGGSHSNGPGF
jgi:predicted metal-dependent phosphoesterase TrpH